MAYKTDACHYLAWYWALTGYGKDQLSQLVSGQCDLVKFGHGAGSLVSQWGGTVKLPPVHTVRTWFQTSRVRTLVDVFKIGTGLSTVARCSILLE